MLEHLRSHWPYRSWCKHCVRGRAASSHHKARSDEDREFARSGTPTLRLDHRFLGSEEDAESAPSSPYLIVSDNASEALYALAVPDKACHPWVVEYVYQVIEELGYGGTRIASKSDIALELRQQVAAKRSAPTVPLNVPVRESKANGAVENAVRRWQGQFRTLKSQLDFELGGELPRDHPVLQWLAIWAGGVLNRVPVRSHGRTVHEFVIGHKMKTPLSLFGESVMWRKKRHSGALNKYDSECAEGVYFGVAGLSVEALIGTPTGIVRTNEYRPQPIGQWNRELVLSILTTFQE